MPNTIIPPVEAPVVLSHQNVPPLLTATLGEGGIKVVFAALIVVFFNFGLNLFSSNQDKRAAGIGLEHPIRR